MIYYLIIFILGLLIGSFLNSVIYRLEDLKSIFKERSICPHCKKTLRWYDMIPLASFIIYAGRCRYCREKISIQYPLVELTTAVLFICIYGYFGITLYSILLLLLSCFLIVIFVYDIYYMIIPDEMLWPAIIIVILSDCYIAILSQSFLPMWNALLGALIAGSFIGLIVLLTRARGMGIGDIKLAFLIGLLIAYPQIILSLFLAFFIGSIIGIVLLASRRKKLKSAIAFAPYLIIGFYITIFWGQKILNWYLRI